MVYMVPSKIYKGIEYIQLDELPLDQQEKIQKTLSREFFIKILVNGQIVSNCIQYRHYRNWFESVYVTKTIVREVIKTDQVLENIALKPA